MTNPYHPQNLVWTHAKDRKPRKHLWPGIISVLAVLIACGTMVGFFWLYAPPIVPSPVITASVSVKPIPTITITATPVPIPTSSFVSKDLSNQNFSRIPASSQKSASVAPPAGTTPVKATPRPLNSGLGINSFRCSYSEGKITATAGISSSLAGVASFRLGDKTASKSFAANTSNISMWVTTLNTNPHQPCKLTISTSQGSSSASATT